MLRTLATIALLAAGSTVAAAQDTLTTVPAPAPAPVPTTPDSVTLDRVVAVVGNQPILWTEVLEYLNQQRAQGLLPAPRDSAQLMELARRGVSDLVDEEVLLQRARADTAVQVTDQEVSEAVDRQLREIRGRFPSEAEFRSELARAGLGTPEQYRRSLMDEARRALLQRKLIEKLQAEGKLYDAPVSEEEITRAFEANRERLPSRPATVTFRQLVIAPQASEAARERARAKAESLLVELRRGGDFEQIARRESMDPTSAERGGDLGWHRRGVMVPEFERWMFALPPGQTSPVVETVFGYHIIRVDRATPAEVKVRHILIRPEVDSADVARARARADTAATMWRSGVSFDSLVTRFHDPREEKLIPTPFPRDSLPASYQTALAGLSVNQISEPFPIEDPRADVPKFVVAQLTSETAAGAYGVADLRERIRSQLAREKAYRRLIDELRASTFVSIRL